MQKERQYKKTKFYCLKHGIIAVINFITFSCLFFVIQSSIEKSLLDIPVLWILFVPIFLISLPLVITIAGLGFIFGGNYGLLGQSGFGIIILLLLAIIYYFFLGIGVGLLAKKLKL